MAISITVGPSLGSITSGNNSFTVTLTGTTSGRSVVVGIAWQSAFGSVTSVDCGGQAMTLQGSAQATSSFSKLQFATLNALTSGGDKTITITMSNNASANNQASAYAVELSGTDTTDVFDAVNGSAATSSSPSTSVTTGSTGNAIFALAVADTTSSGDFGAGSGYTLISMTDSSNRQFQGEYDLDAGTAGSKTVDFTLGGSQSWAVVGLSVNVEPASFTRTPTTGTIVLAGVQPSVGLSVSVTPSVGAIGLAGAAAFVSSTLSPTIAPTVGVVALAGASASVTTSATNDGAVSLLAHTLSAQVESDEIVLAATLPAHSASGTISSEGIATAAITLLAHSIEAGGNHGLDATLPAHSISATAVNGTVASAGLALLAHTIVADASVTNVITATPRLLTHALSASGIPENVATLTRTLAAHTISADLLAGNTSSASIELLVHTLNVLAFPESVATADIRLASHYLDAYATPSIAETFRSWVMNTRNGAVSEYTNFQFNSIVKFGSVYLAAGPSGVVVLGGDTDAGEEIDARARTGQLNYGSSFLKRIPRLYVSHSADGDLVFRTITQEGGTRSYLLQVNGIVGEQQRRVPVGIGPKSVRWQFELANRAGSDFSLSSILVYPKTLGRRIQ